MLAAGMMCLISQQRRLLSGQKHISFSRDQGSAKACATNTEPGGNRRRKRATDPKQKPQGQQQAGRSAASSEPGSSSRPDTADARAQERFLRHAASLGVVRASELKDQSQKQSRAAAMPHTHNSQQSAPSSSGSEASSVADTPTSSALSSSTYDGTSSSSSRISSLGSSGDHSTDGGHSGSLQSSSRHSSLLTEEDEAVIAAMNRISRFMDFRERCGSEVVDKLKDLGYEPQFAVKVLRRMQQTGLQDDGRFAEMYARGQWTLKSQAPSKIAYELRMRRVAQEHIDAALAAVFGDSKQLAGREPSDAEQEASWEQLVEVCRQRVELTRMDPPQKRRQKLAAWLQRRGHSLATAFRMFEVLGI